MLLSVRSSASYDLPEDSFVLLMVEPLLIGPRHRVKEERLMTTQTQTA
jgi:transglutaminase-like putative cysteine protease